MNSDCIVTGGEQANELVCRKSSRGFKLSCAFELGSAQGCSSPEQKIA